MSQPLTKNKKTKAKKKTKKLVVPRDKPKTFKKTTKNRRAINSKKRKKNKQRLKEKKTNKKSLLKLSVTPKKNNRAKKLA